MSYPNDIVVHVVIEIWTKLCISFFAIVLHFCSSAVCVFGTYSFPSVGSFVTRFSQKLRIRSFWNFTRNGTSISARKFSPPLRSWDSGFSLYSFVCCSSARSGKISKSVPRSFLKLGTKLGFLMRRKWHFEFLPRKSYSTVLALFGKKWQFLTKNHQFSQFLKILWRRSNSKLENTINK